METITSEIKLKPCPFCGSDDVHIESKNLFYWVECYQCGATGQEARLRDETVNVAQGEERATNNWNTRPIEDELRSRAEKAEAMIDKLVDAGNDLYTAMQPNCELAAWDKTVAEWHDCVKKRLGWY